MFIPRFSLRTILWIVTICAVIFVINVSALQGKVWAIVVSVAILSVPVVAVFYALFFVGTLAMGHFLGTEELIARTSQGGIEHGTRDRALESSSTSATRSDDASPNPDAT